MKNYFKHRREEVSLCLNIASVQMRLSENPLKSPAVKRCLSTVLWYYCYLWFSW